MKIPVWKEGMTAEQERDIAYMERNLLALGVADGWYVDPDPQMPGYSRVLSLADGAMTFHIHDDFEVGDLRQIADPPASERQTAEDMWRPFFEHYGITETVVS